MQAASGLYFYGIVNTAIFSEMRIRKKQAAVMRMRKMKKRWVVPSKN